MKDNIKLILIIAVAFVGVSFFSSLFDKPVSQLAGIYIKNNPTQATSSVSATSVIKLLSANPGRQNLVACVDNDRDLVRLWLRTASTTGMTMGSNSSGIRIAAGSCWNMQDYGILWVKEVFAFATPTDSIIQYIEY